jgi:hypothetical protein
MKKHFFTLAVLLFCAVSGAYAQQYTKGDITANAGISFGTIGYSWGWYGNSSGFLPVTLNAEYSLNDKFAVGPYLGYYGRSFKYGDGYKDKFTALSFGARGTFHASAFLNETLNWNINEEKLDLYASVMIGLETNTWKFDNRFTGDNTYSNGTSLLFGPVIGARYNFNPGFGAFAELGRGAFGYITLGASARF